MKKNQVAHFEIYADDPDKLGHFYTSLFDWNIEHVPAMEGYGFVKTIETVPKGTPVRMGGINGGILKRPAGYHPTAWVNYVNVDSVDAAVARAKQLGAKVTKAKTAAPGMGWYAMLTDPQGNAFAVWESDANAK